MNFRSFEAYNSTLQQLKHALLASKVFFSIETATSIVCLAMVEVSVVASLDWSLVIIPICQLMFPTSSAGLFAHFAGFNALVKSYPPDLFSSDLFHAIFVGCRPILVSFMMFGSLAAVFFDKFGSFFMLWIHVNLHSLPKTSGEHCHFATIHLRIYSCS